MVGFRSRVTGFARQRRATQSTLSRSSDMQRRTRGSASLPATRAATSHTRERGPTVALSILREICLRSTARRGLWRRLLFSRVARLTRLFLPNTLTFFGQLTCRMAFTRPESERYSCNQHQILLHRVGNWITQRSGRKDSHKGHEGHEGNTKVVQTRRCKFHLIYLNL